MAISSGPKLKKQGNAHAMPAEVFHLYTRGSLTPEDNRRLGIPVMHCTECQSEVTLVTLFEPISETQLSERLLPGLIWEKDVAVMCPRCTFGGFTQ